MINLETKRRRIHAYASAILLFLLFFLVTTDEAAEELHEFSQIALKGDSSLLQSTSVVS